MLARAHAIEAPDRPIRSEAASPRRADRLDVRTGRRSHPDQSKAGTAPRRRDRGGGSTIQAVEAIDPVGRDDRREDLEAPALLQRRDDAPERPRIKTEDTAEQ